MSDKLTEVARRGFIDLGVNPYPGRGIILGMDQSGRFMVQVYWIMGNDTDSRNQVLNQDDGGRVFAEAADFSKIINRCHPLYTAMVEKNSFFVVGNGHQTEGIAIQMGTGMSVRLVLSHYLYKFDQSDFTPRISGICDLINSPRFLLSITRKSPWDDSCQRFLYEYEKVAPGFGYCVTTYTGNGDPLPSFQGEPKLMPLEGSLDKIAQDYWDHLYKENKVSLAVKFIPIAVGRSAVAIHNQYTKI